jgi:hypothetical protein
MVVFRRSPRRRGSLARAPKLAHAYRDMQGMAEVKAIIAMSAVQLSLVVAAFLYAGWIGGLLVAAFSFWPHARHVYMCRRDFGRWFV